MQNVVITGANRGIGLAIAREYLENSDARVFATARTPDTATDLKTLQAEYGNRLHLIQLDVANATSVDSAAEAVAAQVNEVHILINNAGVNLPGGEQTLDSIDIDAMLDVMRVNVGGPVLVTRAFRKLLAAADNARLVVISSQMGSMSWMQRGGFYAYSPSKAAANMVTRAFAGDLKSDGVISVTVHPGWVQTDMGGASAALTPVESARGIVSLTQGLTPDQNGMFFRWDGTEHPW